MDRVDLRRGRLVLTRPTAHDIDRITELCQDETIRHWTLIPSPYTRRSAENFLRTEVRTGWDLRSPTWAMRLLPSDTVPNDAVPNDAVPEGEGAVAPIDAPVHRDLDDVAEVLDRAVLHGMISLMDRGGGVYEIGYWLDPAVRGTGLMTAAADAVLDVAVRDLQAEVVTWRCLVLDGEPNWASWRVAWRLGFHLDGVLRRQGRQRGVAYDSWAASWLPGEPRRPVSPWRGPAPLGAGVRPSLPDPRDPEALVRQFHETYTLPVSEGAPDVDVDRVHMRMGLVAEEFAELVGAVYGEAGEQEVLRAFETARAGDDGSRDTVEAADALADLVYVIYGMALETGIPMEDVLAEVQASNLSKLGEDGRPIYREDGKVLKGPGYGPPDVAAVLHRATEASTRRGPTT